MASIENAQLDAPPAADAGVVRFHLSLNVDDLRRSVAFYQVLFDTSPARLESDYAKFELAQPPLVMSLEPNHAPRGGKLNHLGFRLTSAETLVDVQRRLESNGISTQREDGVECCYSRQTKFWVSDPDGNMWEMYTLQESLDHRGGGQRPCVPEMVVNIQAAPAIWAHRLGEPLPEQILAADDSVDEVLLEGTFNARLSTDERRRALAEVLRVLKPGGKLSLHQLTARTPLPSLSQALPGPASVVEAVPSAAELVRDLEAAGFTDLHFEKLGDGPCFVADGVECRETRLVAQSPAGGGHERTREVLFKGPARTIEDDAGHHFQRGCWTSVDDETYRRLRSGPLAAHFTF
ncbi:MAG: ArsI/CadI family heavy metal resistance metalloenzyme [Pirellulales bacterium]